MTLFSASKITAGYGKQTIVKDISFTIDRSCLTGILGANGSGKTTLLKAICGILSHEGSCCLNGTTLEQLPPRQLAQRCSYIPQRSGISIDISCLDVVLMGFNPRLGLLEHPGQEMREQAVQTLEAVGLTGMENINYLCLSEGQKQLCILARTLVSDAQLLLLDEPESALDFRFRYQVLETLKTWLTQKQRAAIVTLHDATIALNDCDKLILLSEGAVSGIIDPRTDSIDKMESLLSRIYGPLSLQRCLTRGGRERLIMLKEDGP